MPRSIRIGGKEYVTVAEKVKEAHADHGFTMVSSEMVEVHGRWFMRATLLVPTDDGQHQQFIGTAEIKFDNAKPGTADATNPLECAETSALGRALAFAGYGVVDSIASADEVARAQQNASQRAPQSAGAASPPAAPTATPRTTPAASERQSGPSGTTGPLPSLDASGRPATVQEQTQLLAEIKLVYPGLGSTDSMARQLAVTQSENFVFSTVKKPVTMRELRDGEARITLGDVSAILRALPTAVPAGRSA